MALWDIGNTKQLGMHRGKGYFWVVKNVAS
jgi:hypothetical protein